MLFCNKISGDSSFIKQDSIICGQNDKNNCKIAASFENVHKIDVNINCAQEKNDNGYNRFTNISKIIWNGCEAHNDLEFQHIPDKESVKHLEIVNFILMEIPKVSFDGFKNLETLVIKNCFIQFISGGSFDGLESLKVLNISKNTVRIVDVHVLHKLINLEHLVVDDESNFTLNSINFGEDQILQNLTSNSNHIILNEKFAEIFQHVKDVHIQDIAQEQIIVNGESFNSSIESFSFTNSFIKDVYLDTLPSLKHLNLCGNYINHNSLRLYALRNLVVLDLSRNNLGDIEEHFSELSALKVLDLTSNHIQSISRDAFHGLQNIEEVILMNNNLRDFEVNVPINLNTKFFIDENYFDCKKLVEINRDHPETF